MKRILGLILALCLVFALVSEAAAAGKPSFTQQPKSATTDKKGTVSFSVKVKTNGSNITYTWYFVNPATGEKTSGKNLSKTVKGVKVSKPNSAKVTLKKVPESMHGWQVFCHINGNGYKVDSEIVTLNVYGLDPVESPAAESGEEAPAEAPAEEAPAEEAPAEEAPAEEAPAEEAPAEEAPAEEAPAEEAPAEEAPAEEAPAEEAPAEEAPAEGEAPAEEPEERELTDEEKLAAALAAGDEINEGADVSDKEITVSASGSYLYAIDSIGNLTREEAYSSLTFMNTGNVAIKSDDPIKSWTINGIRFESDAPQTTINLFNIDQDLAISLSTEQKTAASAQVDENVICKVTCEGCVFTCTTSGIRKAENGEVPSGSVISVIATSSDALANGYVINGGEPEHKKQASFQLTVTGDTTIVLK